MSSRFHLSPLVRLLLTAVVVGLSARYSRAAESFITTLTFPVTDTRAAFTVRVSRDVVVEVTRAVDAQGRHFGWDLSATDRRLKNSPNFFYGCLCGHGPSPHALYAWHFVQMYYPSERILSIYGYPLEVRVRCVDCSVIGSGGTEARFTAGTVEVGLRRLATPNHRQSRISDIATPKKPF
jgi:hypothetical protein